MSRIYPERHKRGFWHKLRKFRTTSTDDGARVRLHNETDYKEIEVKPAHAGWVLRDGVYVWGGKGNPRKEP